MKTAIRLNDLRYISDSTLLVTGKEIISDGAIAIKNQEFWFEYQATPDSDFANRSNKIKAAFKLNNCKPGKISKETKQTCIFITSFHVYEKGIYEKEFFVKSCEHDSTGQVVDDRFSSIFLDLLSFFKNISAKKLDLDHLDLEKLEDIEQLCLFFNNPHLVKSSVNVEIQTIYETFENVQSYLEAMKRNHSAIAKNISNKKQHEIEILHSLLQNGEVISDAGIKSE